LPTDGLKGIEGNNMNIKKLVYAAVAIGCFALTARALQSGGSIPNWINYQGRLTKPSGAVVDDGSYSVNFKLVNGANAVVWEDTKDVAVKQGVFSTRLGYPGGLPIASINGAMRLRVTVGTTVLPDQELGAVAFALMAQTVPDGAISEAKLAPGLAIPLGGVIAWWGNAANVPSGWKLCDGSVISGGHASLNGQSAPNLVGRVIRGASGNVFPNAPTGGADSVNLAHTHSIIQDLGEWRFSATHHNHGGGALESGVSPGTLDGSGFVVVTGVSGSDSARNIGHAHGGVTGANLGPQSIIPTNTGLLYIMRMK
jgi:hypothetical protein